MRQKRCHKPAARKQVHRLGPVVVVSAVAENSRFYRPISEIAFFLTFSRPCVFHMTFSRPCEPSGIEIGGVLGHCVSVGAGEQAHKRS